MKANPKDVVLAKKSFKIQVMKCYLERHLPEKVKGQMP